MDDVANINRATLQGIVDKSHLSLQQKNMVWEIRRKNKNRLAAAKCRKRKLEIITNKSYTREELRYLVLSYPILLIRVPFETEKYS